MLHLSVSYASRPLCTTTSHFIPKQWLLYILFLDLPTTLCDNFTCCCNYLVRNELQCWRKFCFKNQRRKSTKLWMVTRYLVAVYIDEVTNRHAKYIIEWLKISPIAEDNVKSTNLTKLLKCFVRILTELFNSVAGNKIIQRVYKRRCRTNFKNVERHLLPLMCLRLKVNKLSPDKKRKENYLEEYAPMLNRIETNFKLKNIFTNH